jgi:hypothetical protein
MRTTLKGIRNATTLGPAEEIVAPQNVFSASDSAFSVVLAAFRSAQVDGREPHAVYLSFNEGVNVEALFPADAEVIRSAANEEGALLLAHGLGYSLLAATFSEPSVWVSASTRAQANAIATDLRTAAPTAEAPAQPNREAGHDRAPGQYL